MSQTYDVVIVGAGAAGVGACRALAGGQHSVLLLEASGRVGGRAWTQVVRGMTLDLGCGWLHSGERNVWRGIAEAAGVAVDYRESAWLGQYRDLGFSATDQTAAQAAFAAWGARLEDGVFADDVAAGALEPDGVWNGFIEALSGYINGAELAQLSVADYLAYDRAASEVNWRLRGGYGSLVASHLPEVPTRFCTPVRAIDHGGRVVRVETAAGVVECRCVIVTVSTAVLAGGGIQFTPGLDEKLQDAAYLPLGLANKVFLAIEGSAPFEDETHVIGDARRADTGSYYIRPFGMPVIECFFGGPGARRLERAGLDAAIDFAKEELAGLFGADVRRHLVGVAGSAWGESGFIGGSYSHALPGRSGHRARLAAPVEGRVFFAGEATHGSDFSTAHGAYESGVRAGREVLAVLG